MTCLCGMSACVCRARDGFLLGYEVGKGNAATRERAAGQQPALEQRAPVDQALGFEPMGPLRVERRLWLFSILL